MIKPGSITCLLIIASGLLLVLPPAASAQSGTADGPKSREEFLSFGPQNYAKAIGLTCRKSAADDKIASADQIDSICSEAETCTRDMILSSDELKDEIYGAYVQQKRFNKEGIPKITAKTSEVCLKRFTAAYAGRNSDVSKEQFLRDELPEAARSVGVTCRRLATRDKLAESDEIEHTCAGVEACVMSDLNGSDAIREEMYQGYLNRSQSSGPPPNFQKLVATCMEPIHQLFIKKQQAH